MIVIPLFGKRKTKDSLNIFHGFNSTNIKFTSITSISSIFQQQNVHTLRYLPMFEQSSV